jgi:hypothetical protein
MTALRDVRPKPSAKNCVTSGKKAWMVSGGVTEAPKECRDKAVEAVERIIRSFEPNTDIGAPPPAAR